MARARNRTKDQIDPKNFIGCHVPRLPAGKIVKAAEDAIEAHPANAPSLVGLALTAITPALEHLARQAKVHPHVMRAAIVTTKYWGSKGVRLGVYFMDTSDSALKNRILSHMNAWGQDGKANVTFLEASAGNAQVRIARTRGEGYYSYLGRDIMGIPRNQKTMNLESFSMSTPESEYRRVVRHETGHTLGMPHEHMRADIVKRLDRQKTIAYFQQFQGWSPEETTQQVLTPLPESSLLNPTPADVTSIMAYQLPGSITVDGQPIPGGNDINPQDADYIARQYPGSGTVNPPPPAGGKRFTLTGKLAVKTAPFLGSLVLDSVPQAYLNGTLTFRDADFEGTATEKA